MRRFRTLFWLNMISGLSLFGALIYLNYDSAGEVGGLIFLNILVFIYLIFILIKNPYRTSLKS